MTFLSRLGLLAAAFLFTLGPVTSGKALAQLRDYQLGFQDAVTPVAERIDSFHDILLWLITLITIFVLVLLLWVMYRFSEKRNPTPSKTTHHVGLEHGEPLLQKLDFLPLQPIEPNRHRAFQLAVADLRSALAIGRHVQATHDNRELLQGSLLALMGIALWAVFRGSTQAYRSGEAPSP